MALAHYQGYVENVSTGKALPGAVIRVYSYPGNVLQSTFADLSSTPLPTVLTDSNGAFEFYIPDGAYDLEYVFNGDVLTRLVNIPIYNPANALPAATLGAFGTTLVANATAADARADLAINSAAEIAASGGSALVGFLQSGTGAVASTQQERLRREVWAEDFMTLPAVGDQTAAFQAAIDSLPANGGTVRFRGDYTVGTTNPIRFPAEPKIIHLLGEGRSRLLQGAANAPMIAKVVGVSRVIGAHIKGFTLIAHVDSLKATATNILINIAGFDWSQIDVEYKSNAVFTATNGRAYAVIAGHANGIPCYNNSIRLEMQQTAGPAKGVWLHNNGGTALANANVNEVSVWSYALDTCTAAIDAGDSTQTLVHSGLFEDCPGMTGVIAGNFTKTRDNWFELVGTAIDYTQTASTTANNCVSEHDQFSGANTIVIHSGVAAPPRFEAPLFGTMTFNDQSAAATTNYIMPTIANAQAAGPSFALVLIGGAVVADLNSLRHRTDHHGVTTYMMRWNITPAGTGREIMRLTPPAGYEIEQASFSVINVGVAQPLPVGLSNAAAGTDWEVWWPNTNVHTVNVRVTMRAL